VSSPISQIVKDIRQKNGLTQHQLAKMLGVTQAYISRIEREDLGYLPSDRFLHKVHWRFDYDLDKLLLAKQRGK
jgi:transcriptional regulator with XRE-family HTH domain